MANALVRQDQPITAQIEQVVITGDLKGLSAAQRVDYYNRVCQSVGLNPYTRPFEYITLNGKLTLYARRDAADQLRSLHGISLSKPHIEYTDDMVIVTVEATDKTGRTDCDLGAVSIKGLQGENRANAILKSITKAKRRVTLSLAGLGWLDETEVDSIPGAQRVVVTETGEIVDGTVDNPFNDAPPPITLASAQQLDRLEKALKDLYGDKWDKNTAKWAEWATTGVTDDITKLSGEEVEAVMEKLIERIAKKKEKAAQAAQPQAVAVA